MTKKESMEILDVLKEMVADPEVEAVSKGMDFFKKAKAIIKKWGKK